MRDRCLDVGVPPGLRTVGCSSCDGVYRIPIKKPYACLLVALNYYLAVGLQAFAGLRVWAPAA